MSRTRFDPLEGTWIEAISVASDQSPEDVAQFLDRHDFRQTGIIPRPVDITVRRVTFRGTKNILGELIPFDFEWNDLGPGVWLVGSDKNSAGKTSLFGVMRFMLRGSWPDTVPPEVLSWIQGGSLEFDLGDVRHTTFFTQAETFAAKLTKQGPEGNSTLLFASSTKEEFANAMSDYMLSALGLDTVTGRRAGGGTGARSLRRHYWPALFAAFHVGTDYGALLGNTAEDGLPNRMLNMFAGFPHASAVAKISLLTGGLSAELDQEMGTQQAVADHASHRVERLEAEKRLVEDKVAALESVPEILNGMREANTALALLYDELPRLKKAFAAASDAEAAAKAETLRDKLALQHFNEDRAASRVFRALEPKCCPRCDRGFGQDRKAREQKDMQCMVCGEDAPIRERGDAEMARLTLVANLDISAGVFADAKRNSSAVRSAVEDHQGKIGKLEGQIEGDLLRQATASAGQDLVMRLAVLNAMIADAQSDVAVLPMPKSKETRIADACDKVFRARLKEEQNGVISDVSLEIRDLLRKLGMTDVEDVVLSTIPTLTVTKGSVPSNYKGLSQGEKLRAKLAIVLALMKVAHRREVGRHPGILFIDTPAAQEVTDDALEALAAGLVSLMTDLPTLQVFIATTHTRQFASAIPPEKSLLATGDGKVW